MSRILFRRIAERWKHAFHFTTRRKHSRSDSSQRKAARELWKNDPFALRTVRQKVIRKILFSEPDLFDNLRQARIKLEKNVDPSRKISLSEAVDFYRTKAVTHAIQEARPFAAHAATLMISLSPPLSSSGSILTRIVSSPSFPYFNLSQSLSAIPRSQVEVALEILRPILGNNSYAFLSDYHRILRNMVKDFSKML